MSKKTPKPDFAQIALSVVQQATGAKPLAGQHQIALASAPKRRRKSGKRK